MSGRLDTDLTAPATTEADGRGSGLPGGAVRVRRMTPGGRDVDSAARLHLASWHATYDPLLPRRARLRFHLDERQAAWRAALGDPSCRSASYLAELEGRPVGLVLARRLGGPGSAWRGDAEPGSGAPGAADPANGEPATGEVEALHVAPRLRGAGIGRRLVTVALDALRDQGCRDAVLWVLADNAAARAFYERLGWVRDGEPVRRPMGGRRGLPVVVEVRYRIELGTAPDRGSAVGPGEHRLDPP